ncbi:two pore domain potassium channel family protein [Nocardia beijingensis]|uniref:potassium channel family protein n=1 Tax=Nocardia beijingensis TaxID=95162 RepID=UPI0018962B65|nr:potassium channel family protein [Nocardia beijingensis]MBF6466022.1 two pore domain potassium channel family protein [Nocardia beijingensis]
MTENRAVGRFSRALHNLLAVVCALLFYYFLPLETVPVGRLSGAPALVAFIVGVAGLIWLARWRIRRYIRDPRATVGRINDVLLVVCVVVTFFALYYYVLEQRAPGQFENLHTRTDALYYTMVTLGTVGYGDVHAVGTAAKVATMVQVAFDLGVIGILIAISTSHIIQQLDEAQRNRPAGGAD